MSTINIETGTVEESAALTKREVPEWYEEILSCYRILLDMIDNGVWQEPVTEALATEFNDIIICGYANPRKKVLTTFTDHLQTVARNYTQAETANLNR